MFTEAHANVPAADLARARAFYTDTLGLTPTSEDDYAVRFAMPGGGWFQVYETAFAGTGKHTIAQLDVTDIAAAVAELTDAGVAFEHYDMPGVTWEGSVAHLGDQRTAWFTDSEGNILCLDERSSG